MAFKSGHLCKVTLGSNTVVGMGNWTMDGVQTDQMETTVFGQQWKTFEFGLKDGGQITFNGLFDPADSTGQMTLQGANAVNTDITNIRLYIDSTSYYEPCQTTGYFAPGALSTGYETIKSWVNVSAYNVNADKSNMMQTSFTLKISGMMALV